MLWENAVFLHLCKAGLEPIARNFNCRFGEIDLIMLDKITLDKITLDKIVSDKREHSIVFVEVRYRNTATHGDGVASIGAGKRAKLVRAAEVYLQEHEIFADSPCRFDIVACTGTPEQPRFDWIRNAFDAH
jgi:putative endonuclease